MLLILSKRTDDHVRFLLGAADKRGAGRDVAHRWIDTADFPARATVSLAFGGGAPPRRRAIFDGEPLDLDRVSAVWYRYPGEPTPHESTSAAGLGPAARSVSAAVLRGLDDILDVRWLPARPRAVLAAQSKVHQMALAPTLGFALPRTLVTNDPADLLAFWEACEGRMVAKVPNRIAKGARPDGWRGMATHVVRRRDLASFRALGHAPMILQEYVPKRLELRVTVVGRRVFPCAIDSQASRATRDDWRHHDHDRARLSAHALPDDVAARCVRLVEAYGLRYGAIDLVVTPDGEHVFLELNPMGEWAWVELETGMPIADAILDELLDA